MKIDFLMWTTNPTELDLKVSEDGMMLFVSNKIPSRFVGVDRILREYRAAGIAAFAPGIQPNDVADMMFQNANAHMMEIHNMFNLQDIKPTVLVPLPFQCLQDFIDPYLPAAPGFSVKSYPHETAPGGTRFFVLHVNLEGATVARRAAAAAPVNYVPC